MMGSRISLEFTQLDFMVGFVPGLFSHTGNKDLICSKLPVYSSFMAMYFNLNLMLNPSKIIIEFSTSSLIILPVFTLSKLGNKEITALPITHIV